MKELKLYFDTSVFNFAFADDSPNEKEITLKLLREVVGVNILMGYKEIDIYSPREVVEDEGT